MSKKNTIIVLYILSVVTTLFARSFYTKVFGLDVDEEGWSIAILHIIFLIFVFTINLFLGWQGILESKVKSTNIVEKSIYISGVFPLIFALGVGVFYLIYIIIKYYVL